MNEKLQDILIAAAEVVVLRRGDIVVANTSLATVDVDAVTRLDCAISAYFELGI